MKMRATAIGLALAAGLGFAVALAAQESKPVMTVYKSPTCGCCGKWIEHMKASGFEVKSNVVPDVNPIKKSNGVPNEGWSCHTALVSGYVLEGHVPASAVKKKSVSASPASISQARKSSCGKSTIPKTWN